MNTAIDAGNTLIKAGFFEGKELREIISVPAGQPAELYKKLPLQLGHCILSSVIPLPGHIISYLKMKSSSFMELNTSTPLPLENKYGSPATLGADRLGAAIGAASLYPGKAILAITAGSCITYNVVDEQNAYIGGAISPGLQMRFKALNEFTAALPLVAPQEKAPLIGKNTNGSILSGVVNGLIFEIKEYIAACRKKYNSLQAVLSGGDSRYLGRFLEQEVELCPELVLHGLHQILEFNVKKAS